jgi:hypothetical protein
MISIHKGTCRNKYRADFKKLLNFVGIKYHGIITKQLNIDSKFPSPIYEEVIILTPEESLVMTAGLQDIVYLSWVLSLQMFVEVLDLPKTLYNLPSVPEILNIQRESGKSRAMNSLKSSVLDENHAIRVFIYGSREGAASIPHID